MYQNTLYLPQMSDYIDHVLVIKTGENECGLISEKLLPNPCNGLVINFGGKVSLIPGSGKEPVLLPRCYFALAATSRNYVRLNFIGDYDSIILTFHPGKLYSLFRFPIGILNGEIFVNAEIIAGAEFNRVMSRVFSEGTTSGRIELLHSYLMNLKQQQDDKHFISSIVDQIIQLNGCTRIDRLAAANHITRRSLERQFSHKLGITPVQYARIVRGQSIIKYCLLKPETLWQDIVAGFNYYDQAHFINDFKKFTGETPSEYFRNSHIMERMVSPS